jgi:DnaJ-domain-containing protein 1
MNLPGRLRRTSLGDLLGTLYRAGVSGVLELVEAQGAASGRAHRIYFADGLVDGVETALPSPRLGEVLNREGVLAREALTELARRLIHGPGSRAGEILVEARLATPEAVRSGLRRQLKLRLEALFGLDEAYVRFRVRRPSHPDGSRPRPLTPPEFLHGRVRARARAPKVQPVRPEARLEAYRVLGLPALAAPNEVRRAFRTLAAEAHPDRNPGASIEERNARLKRFAELSAAYHLLVR